MARKVEKFGEAQRKGHHAATGLCNPGFSHRLGAKQMRTQGLRRGLHQVGQVLELGQFTDKADDGRHIVGLGGACVESSHGLRILR